MTTIEEVQKRFELKVKELKEILPGHYKTSMTSARNCAAWTVASMLDILGIDNLNLINMATPLAVVGGNCGAVEGGLMIVGLILGKKGKKELNHLVATMEGLKFVKQFEKEFGSIKCKDLTGLDLLTEKGQKAYVKENIWEKKCYKHVIGAVETIRDLYKRKIAKII
ncbi:MAG: C_GCAxxG_C_C family protein [Candidatus Helarchaeota archaeon]|nr:C_GCAxxG_C_C family protein [Candidatus Helarchaeota archaeon]